MTSEPTDFDSPWKEILEHYLQEFMAFFFPEVHQGVDWGKPPTFKDKELQQVTRDAEVGRRLVDKLVEVQRNDGTETWVLVHIEVQSQPEVAFEQRMFGYYSRLLDQYNRPVVSLAVLGDERHTWRPHRFSSGLWGCTVAFDFPMIKLLDYSADWAALEASTNPFATVVMAHLQTQQTRNDARQRQQVKMALSRRLYEVGYTRRQIIDLYLFIDWVLRLPPELEAEHRQALQQYEETRSMPYISSIERFGIQKGLEQGRQEGLQQGLQLGRQEGQREGLLAAIELGLEWRFGEAGRPLLDEIRWLDDLTILRAIYQQLKTGTTMEALRGTYVRSEPRPPSVEG